MSRDSRREVERLLEAAARDPVPPPDPGFVDALEDRLLTTRLDVDTRLHRVPRGRLVVAFATAALLASAGVGGALAGWFDAETAAPSLALAAARGTVVELPGGRSVTGRPGLDLPDGSVVRTGPDGEAVAGGVRLGPEEEAVVARGRLRRRSDGRPTEPTATTRPPVSSTTSTTLGRDGGVTPPDDRRGGEG